jgi:hypothetical protein
VSLQLETSTVTASVTLGLAFPVFFFDTTSAALAITLRPPTSTGQLLWLIRHAADNNNDVVITPSSTLIRDAIGQSIGTVTLDTIGSCVQFVGRLSPDTWYTVGGTGWLGTVL